MSNTKTRLLELPVELLDEITGLLEQRDLFSWIRVCRLFHAIGEPKLYAHVVLSKSQQQVDAFHTALKSKPELKKRVLTATVDALASYYAENATLWSACDAFPLLSSLPNLRLLVIKSPNSWVAQNVHHDMDSHRLDELLAGASLRVLPPAQRTLSHLTTLDVEFRERDPVYDSEAHWLTTSDDDDDDDDDAACSVFLSPTLRDLTLRNWHMLEYDGSRVSSPSLRKHSTPLQRLRLLDCSLNCPAMAALLALPHHLRTLDLSVRWLAPGYRLEDHELWFAVSTLSEWAEAFALQKHALQRLTFCGEVFKLPWTGGLELDLSAMQALREVVFAAQGFLVRYADGDVSGVAGSWGRVLVAQGVKVVVETKSSVREGQD